MVTPLAKAVKAGVVVINIDVELDKDAKKAAGIDKGSQTAGKGSTVGRVTMAQIREIAEQKMQDLNAKDIDGACRMLIGSARSMGLDVME